MDASVQNTKVLSLDPPEETTVSLTLYDLIEAISDEVVPGEEELISEAVVGLIQSGKVKWARIPLDS